MFPTNPGQNCKAELGAADDLPRLDPEVGMVARTSTWTGSPEALDKWEAHVAARVSGFVAGLPGNAGGAFFIDREAGRALTLTLWETEEAAAETDKFAEQSRASTVEATGVELVERGAYAVVMQF
jgi:heme-degrading monooxygenase HmoA